MLNGGPLNLQQWIDEHKSQLKPPVCNQTIWQHHEFIIMVVGGPNQRKDHHVDVAEEIFYQLQGDMQLNIMHEDGPEKITIKQVEIFLLPALVPHSPQRFANTVGLVIERARRKDELDGFQWYCQHCNAKVYEEFLHVDDIVKQLPPVFQRYDEFSQQAKCPQCDRELI